MTRPADSRLRSCGSATGCAPRRPARAAGRADPSLPAALPLLLQPPGADPGGAGARHRDLGAGLRRSRGARLPAGASLGRRADRAARHPGARPRRQPGRALHQPHHLGRADRARPGCRPWSRPGSTMSSSRCRTPSRARADRIGGYRGGHATKLEFASAGARRPGLPLTAERRGAPAEPGPAAGADRPGAGRSAPAGWKWRMCSTTAGRWPTATPCCRPAPSWRPRPRRSRRRGATCEGRLVIDYVVPDYYAKRPKACMGGWGRQFLAVSPGRPGAALPCRGKPAGLRLPQCAGRLAARRLGALRGLQPLPRHRPGCRRPARAASGRELDWGGCRCQAFALLGDAAATDPACALSPAPRRAVAGGRRGGRGGGGLHLPGTAEGAGAG